MLKITFSWYSFALPTEFSKLAALNAMLQKKKNMSTSQAGFTVFKLTLYNCCSNNPFPSTYIIAEIRSSNLHVTAYIVQYTALITLLFSFCNQKLCADKISMIA